MRAGIVAAGLALALAACSPGDTSKIDPRAAAAPVPSETMKQTFASCTWGEVKSSALSIWAFACGPDAGNTHVVANGSGFDIESAGSDGVARRPVVRLFEKPSGAPVEALVPAVRLVSRGPATDTCALTPALAQGQPRPGLYAFAPTGAAKIAWEAAVNGDAPGEPPCGEMGVSFVGDRVFEAVPGAPDTIAFIDFGSEIQIFDVNTLKAIAAR